MHINDVMFCNVQDDSYISVIYLIKKLIYQIAYFKTIWNISKFQFISLQMVFFYFFVARNLKTCYNGIEKIWCIVGRKLA